MQDFHFLSIPPRKGGVWFGAPQIASPGEKLSAKLTEEECGRDSDLRYICQTFSGVGGWVEAFGFPVLLGYRPHSSSGPSGHLPPGGRYWGAENPNS